MSNYPSNIKGHPLEENIWDSGYALSNRERTIAAEFFERGQKHILQRGQKHTEQPILLHLNLKKKWYDMILDGEKKEEYRELKEYWITRILDSEIKHTHIKFRNGYKADAPWFIIELKKKSVGYGKPSLGCPVSECIILKLGDVVASNLMIP